MKTTIDLDEERLARIMKLAGLRTRKAAVELMRQASDLAWQLDRKGHVLPVSDLIIAACAKRIRAVIVSEDRHFRRVPGVQVKAALPSMDLP